MANINYTKPNKLDDFSVWCSKKYPLWCKSNFPFIEDTFEALDTYGLICKIVQYLNETKQNLNTTEDNVQNIYDYVSNYFDNLDVQNEINNKLDEMATDGTLETIINQEIFGEINNKILKNTEELNNLKINKLRNKLYNKLEFFELPLNVPDFLKNRIFFDGENYQILLDHENYKVTSETAKTFYIAPNGDNSKDGLSRENALLTFDSFNAKCSNGDTLIVTSGIYSRDNLGNAVMTKSVNIIFEDNAFVFFGRIANEFTQSNDYSNVYYKENYQNCYDVIDIANINNLVEFKKVNTVEECSQNIGSFAQIGTTLYVNYYGKNPDNKVIVLRHFGGSLLRYEGITDNTNIYVENGRFIGGSENAFLLNNTTAYILTAFFNKCKFLYASQSGFKSLNARTICLNCEASFNQRDGFAYGNSAEFIEINCKGGFNGVLAGVKYIEQNCNGSTAHNGSKGLRINGNYYKSYGANVADVQTDTISLNFNCNAFDSIINANNINAFDSDFCAQQDGTIIYLYNCFSQGSKSSCNLYSTPGSILYYDNKTKFDTKYGNVQQIP